MREDEPENQSAPLGRLVAEPQGDGAHGPFRALLAAAVHHEDAASGLAQAYVGLPPEQRRKLLDAIVADARAEGIDLVAVLVPLFALERDAALSNTLRSHLATAGLRIERAPSAFRMLLAGDHTRGAAMLVRPAHAGHAADVLTLAWSATAGLEHVARHAPRDDAELERVQAELTARVSATLESSPLGFAAEVIATALWQHRRRVGTLPDVLLDFADMLGPHALGVESE